MRLDSQQGSSYPVSHARGLGWPYRGTSEDGKWWSDVVMCVHMRGGDCLTLCSGNRDSLRRRKEIRERRRERNLEKTMGASRWGRGRGDERQENWWTHQFAARIQGLHLDYLASQGGYQGWRRGKG